MRMQCSTQICKQKNYPFPPTLNKEMENGWNLFNINSAASATTGGGMGQNTSSTFTWDTRQHQYHWSNHDSFQHHPATAAATTTTSTTHPEASAVHALLFSHRGTSNDGQQYCSSTSPSSSLYAGVGSQYYHPDPHLMCLKLGKRHYFEDATCPSMRHVAGFSISKRGKPSYGGGGGMVGPSTTVGEVTVAIPATVPRCQVEGCHVALLNAKDYHRRHKVCELHSKAPKVVVHGLEQRFCQQCSRFHAVMEFDDSKRSCRRRLAGHNERRRKTSQHHDLSVSRNNPSQLGRFPYLSSPKGRALSLLSSSNESLMASPDLSSRCSAALRELIAENRAAALLAKQLIVDKEYWPFHHHAMEDLNSNPLASNQHHIFPEQNGWDRYNEAQGTNNVTLDLMQAPTSAFQLLSMRAKSKEEEECSQLWSSFGGTHV